MTRKAGRQPSANPRRKFVMVMLTEAEYTAWRLAAGAYENNMSLMARIAVRELIGTKAINTVERTPDPIQK